jgi:hypothetical protein
MTPEPPANDTATVAAAPALVPLVEHMPAQPPADSRKVKVRVTMFAEPIEVDVGEIPALRGQGLLVDDNPAPPTEGTQP